MPHTSAGRAQHIRREQKAAEAVSGTGMGQLALRRGRPDPFGEGGSWHCSMHCGQRRMSKAASVGSADNKTPTTNEERWD